MGVLAPAPTVLGTLSLLAVVETVCLVHLCVCILFVTNVSSVEPTVMGGVEVSPVTQCVTGAWFLLGVPVIIYGGVGAVFKVASHLSWYLAYLAGSLAVVCTWMIIFIKYGNTCTTVQPTEAGGEIQQASFVCGMSTAMVLVMLFLLMLGIGAAIYLVWSLREYIRQRVETELIRYQEPWYAVAQLAGEAMGPAGWKPAPSAVGTYAAGW